MREAIGSLGLFNIVIFFLALFSGYLCLSVNNSKSYKVKDEIVSIIEKHNGLNGNSITEIQNYFTKVGYRTTGTCEQGVEKGYGANGVASYSRDALFCVKEVVVNEDPQLPKQVYYKVRVFFRLDLPVFGDIFTYDLSGDTRVLYFPTS